MAAVTYHGEFPAEQDTIVQHGYEFSRDGKSVNVTDKDLLAKFAGNRFFKTEGSDRTQVEEAQTEAQTNETETLRAYLAEKNVPVRANANLASLQKARADYDAAVLKAQE